MKTMGLLLKLLVHKGVSFGIGLGVIMVPDLLVATPKMVQNIFGSAVTSGGLAAIVLSLLPQAEDEPSVDGVIGFCKSIRRGWQGG